MIREIEVATSFVTNHLYNRLPRRRVNIFGEELARILSARFLNHWYPTDPEKGCGYRCIKVGRYGDLPDMVLYTAAEASGIPIQDILENLPEEMTLWIDPGEISYKVGDKGTVRVLYRKEPLELASDEDGDSVPLNAEAACFTSYGSEFGLYSGSAMKPDSPDSSGMSGCSSNDSPVLDCKFPSYKKRGGRMVAAPAAIAQSAGPAFGQRCNTPTFTTASFAQTKFGSTKLKTNSKRANRMSPVEFNNYIKQRSLQQHQQQQQIVSPMISPRAITPPSHVSNHHRTGSGNSYLFAPNASSVANGGGGGYGSFRCGGQDLPDGNPSAISSTENLFNAMSMLDDVASSSPFSCYYNDRNSSLAVGSSCSSSSSSSASSTSALESAATVGAANKQQRENSFLDNLNLAANYPSNPYQQLLLAN